MWFNSLWNVAKKVDEKYCQKFIPKWAANRKRNTNRKIETDFFKAYENGEYSSEKIYIIIDSEALTKEQEKIGDKVANCLLYTSPSPRDRTRSRMPSSA